MPHPFFGARDVFYIEKKMAKKKAFLGQASLYLWYATLYWVLGILKKKPLKDPEKGGPPASAFISRPQGDYSL
tara:strand:- start:742 stop:960 length:219 start_codon:yes stop_codon:yes gene_type:complete